MDVADLMDGEREVEASDENKAETLACQQAMTYIQSLHDVTDFRYSKGLLNSLHWMLQGHHHPRKLAGRETGHDAGPECRRRFRGRKRMAQSRETRAQDSTGPVTASASIAPAARPLWDVAAETLCQGFETARFVEGVDILVIRCQQLDFVAAGRLTQLNGSVHQLTADATPLEGAGHHDVLHEQDGPAAASEVRHDDAIGRSGHGAASVSHQDGPSLLP